MSDLQDPKKNSDLYEKSRVYGTAKQKAALNGETKPAVDREELKNRLIGILAVTLMAVFAVAITVGIVNMFRQPQKKPAGGKNGTEITEPTPAPKELNAVFLELDKSGKRIRFYDIKTDEEVILDYNGATRFYGREGSLITAGVLSAGDLLHLVCTAGDDEMLAEAVWDDRIWEKSKIDELEIFPEEHRMVIRNQNYTYSDKLCIIDDGAMSDIENLVPSADRYTIRGEGSVIYEIIVDIGHGKITLLNYDRFIGGQISLGERYAFDIADPAEYVVREGTYRVNASLKRLSASQTIEIGRNSNIYFDLSYYNEPTATPAPTQAPTQTPTPTPALPQEKLNSLSIKDLDQIEHGTDPDHSIYILGPSGGELFIDGYLFGILPCEFEKLTDEADITIIWDSVAISYVYDGADYEGDVILDYTADFAENE